MTLLAWRYIYKYCLLIGINIYKCKMFCGSMTYCQYRVIQGIENEVIGIKEDFSLHTSTLFTVYNWRSLGFS
jgi:hypothetical protein